jgi:hypothetical protein
MPSELEVGYLVGLLVGEGHFGGDGRQPHVTLRMHVRHEAIFHWLERTFPGGRVYGPYHHDGRHYLQWMARGSFLRDELAPLLDRHLSPSLDRHSFDRFQLMKVNYPQLTEAPAADGDPLAAGQPAADAPPVADDPPPADGKTPANSVPVSGPSAPARRAASGPARRHAAADPTPTVPTDGSASLAKLFAELREAWPS